MEKENQYDEFLHKIQQPKMKELWDSKEDEQALILDSEEFGVSKDY